MKTVMIAVGLAFWLSAHAQQQKGPMRQEQRLRDCNANAGSRQGEERKKFMSECLKGAPPTLGKDRTPAPAGRAPTAAEKKQQDQVRNCSRQAAEKGLSGDGRMKFMSSCIKKT